MTLITTPTGNIGSKVLLGLLNTNEQLRVLARDLSKISSEVRKKAELVEGPMEDAETMAKALRRVEQLFLVIPPSNQYQNVDEYYLHFANVACAAIKKEKVKRVVFVSGTALGSDKQAGAMWSSFLVEEQLKATKVDLRILHCGTFMENLFHAVPSIKMRAQFATTVPADVKLPWVATQDIAQIAIELLIDKAWTGQSSVGILGPKDLSYGEIATMISEVMKAEIKYSAATAEDYKTMLQKFGSSPAAAQGLVDIYTSMTKGTFNRVERNSKTSSPTDFREWCKTTLKPRIEN